MEPLGRDMKIYRGEIPLTLPDSPVFRGDALGEGSPTATVDVGFSKASGIVLGDRGRAA